MVLIIQWILLIVIPPVHAKFMTISGIFYKLGMFRNTVYNILKGHFTQ